MTMASRKRNKSAHGVIDSAVSSAVSAWNRADWRQIAMVTAGVVGTALVVGAVVRSRSARRVGLIGLAHLAERNAGRIAGATQDFAARLWPQVRHAANGVARVPAALISRT